MKVQIYTKKLTMYTFSQFLNESTIASDIHLLIGNAFGISDLEWEPINLLTDNTRLKWIFTWYSKNKKNYGKDGAQVVSRHRIF